MYITGSFYGTTDFDPSEESYELSAQGAWDIFTASMFSSDGRLVKSIESGTFFIGPHQFLIDTGGLEPGSYVVTLRTGKLMQRQLLLLH